MNHPPQDFLFTEGVTAKSPAPASADDEELLKKASGAALKWASTQHGSAAEFVRAMASQFGSSIRMYLLDVLDGLRKTQDISRPVWDYLVKTLSDVEIAAALGERHDRPREMPSLDELFARSRQLQTTGKYVEAVRFCAKLKNYSPYNNMLVFIQNPDATFWATASHWRKAFHREINEDARPMLILAPMTPVLLVYDVIDTGGQDLPEWFSEPFRTTGDFSEDRLQKTLQNCERTRIQVVLKSMGMLHGGSAMNRPEGSKVKVRIELKEGEPKATSYATLCHELAHVFLGHLGGDEDGWWASRLGLPRPVRELEAESVAWLVCSRAGLQTKSAEYLAGYLTSPDQQKLVSLDMVAKAASRIEEMGERLLPPKRTKAERAAAK